MWDYLAARTPRPLTRCVIRIELFIRRGGESSPAPAYPARVMSEHVLVAGLQPM